MWPVNVRARNPAIKETKMQVNKDEQKSIDANQFHRLLRPGLLSLWLKRQTIRTINLINWPGFPFFTKVEIITSAAAAACSDWNHSRNKYNFNGHTKSFNFPTAPPTRFR